MTLFSMFTLQLTLCGGVFSIGGTEAFIDSQCIPISHNQETTQVKNIYQISLIFMCQN